LIDQVIFSHKNAYGGVPAIHDVRCDGGEYGTPLWRLRICVNIGEAVDCLCIIADDQHEMVKEL
jgi:hypothetical protein